MLATAEYPRSNTPLENLNPDVTLDDETQAFWGASSLADGRVRSGGGRVLTVVGLGDELAQARERAYAGVTKLAKRLGTEALTYRTDIAAVR